MLSSYGYYNKKIIYFIFAPLLMSVIYLKNLNINFPYFIILFQCIIIASSIKRIKLGYNNKQIIVLALFYLLFIIAVISSLFTVYQVDSLKISFIVFITSIFLTMLVFSDNVPFNTFIKVFGMLKIIGVIQSVIAIFIFFFGSIIQIYGKTVQFISLGPIKIYQIVMGSPPYYRISSMTSNPNSLGIILFLSQIATLYLYKIKNISKIKFIIYYILQIIALLLTQSRSSILTALIMIIIFTFLISKNRLNKFKIFFISFLLIALLYYVIFYGDFKLFNRFKEGLNSRDIAWETLLVKIYKNPFIGAGFGVSDMELLGDLGIKAHNVYINCISEIGIIGFLIFIIIWGLGIIFSLLKLKKSIDTYTEKYTYAVVVSILISLLFHQLFENKLLVYDFVMHFWVYLIAFSTLQLNIKSETN